MTINQVYARYQCPENLRKHMLRVASLSSLILKHWHGEKLRNRDIVVCAALHDIAKPVTFNPVKQKQFIESEDELRKTISMIEEMTDKYGHDEHSTVKRIFSEVGCNQDMIRLVDHLEWIELPKLLEGKDYELLILIYSDMRVGPKGLLPLQHRLQELKKRTGNLGVLDITQSADELEKLLQSFVNFELSAVGDSDINDLFQEILSTEI